MFSLLLKELIFDFYWRFSEGFGRQGKVERLRDEVRDISSKDDALVEHSVWKINIHTIFTWSSNPQTTRMCFLFFLYFFLNTIILSM